MARVSQLHWHALRRPLRGCAIASLVLLAFLAFWQLAVPDPKQGGGLGIWFFFILPVSLVLPCGLALPVSAGRRLWRAGHRLAAFGPVAGLLLGLFGFPALVSAFNGPFFLGLACLMLLLFASATASGYLIATVADEPAATGAKLPVDGPHGDPDINPEDPSGYARDVPPKGEPR